MLYVPFQLTITAITYKIKQCRKDVTVKTTPTVPQYYSSYKALHTILQAYMFCCNR